MRRGRASESAGRSAGGRAIAHALATGAFLAVSGCTDLARFAPGADSALASPTAGIDPGLVEAPESFLASGSASWNGQPTLHGIWVAHADAPATRRVRITDVSTGRAVDGALFRRDRGRIGPDVLISADAARALGLRPGSETAVRIVGLRPVPTAPQVTATVESATGTVPTRPAAVASGVAVARLAPPDAQAGAAMGAAPIGTLTGAATDAPTLASAEMASGTPVARAGTEAGLRGGTRSGTKDESAAASPAVTLAARAGSPTPSPGAAALQDLALAPAPAASGVPIPRPAPGRPTTPIAAPPRPRPKPAEARG